MRRGRKLLEDTSNFNRISNKNREFQYYSWKEGSYSEGTAVGNDVGQGEGGYDEGRRK